MLVKWVHVVAVGAAIDGWLPVVLFLSVQDELAYGCWVLLGDGSSGDSLLLQVHSCTIKKKPRSLCVHGRSSAHTFHLLYCILTVRAYVSVHLSLLCRVCGGQRPICKPSWLLFLRWTLTLPPQPLKTRIRYNRTSKSCYMQERRGDMCTQKLSR